MEEARIEGKALVTTKIERAPRAIMIPDRTFHDIQQFLFREHLLKKRMFSFGHCPN